MSRPVLASRFTAIDETRALAIFSMIIMHFGPGAFQCLPALQPLAEPILFLSWFATTTFVIVFGVTLGFVYFDRFRGPDRRLVLEATHARARLLVLCALLICAPDYINLWLAGDFNASHWLFKTYSIFNYYALALLSVPLWLQALAPAPVRNALLLGAAHWTLALALLWLLFWPLDPALGLQEYLCLNLLSGPYAYLHLSGSAIMAIPVGIALCQAVRAHQEVNFVRRLLPPALALSLAGWLLGEWSGEFSLHPIVAGTAKAPPRVWYWLFFGRAALLLLIGFILLGLKLGAREKKMTYPITLFGQASPPIYTAHTFVLPAWLDHLFFVEGVPYIILRFLLFAILLRYCCGLLPPQGVATQIWLSN